MIKKILLFQCCCVICILMISCTNKSIAKDDKNSIITYNWILSGDNSPDKIKNILDIIGNVNFKKLNDMIQKNNNEARFQRPFYKAFYEYNYHSTKTIENIFKARIRAIDKNEFDDLLFDLYKKDNIRPLIDSVIASNVSYKNLFNNIMKSEDEAYFVYNWGTTSKKYNTEETKKVLDIIGDVNFSKISNIEQRNKTYINYDFYSYPYHNYKTIKNMFDAKTYGGVTEEFNVTIYLLYKKNDIKPIIDKVINSDSKYEKRFYGIQRTYGSEKLNYPCIFLGCSLILIGILTAFIKIKDNKYLLSSILKNKTTTDKDMFIKYKQLGFRTSGIIVIAMGIIDLLVSNSEKFIPIPNILGLAILLINVNYFEHKISNYITNKN